MPLRRARALLLCFLLTAGLAAAPAALATKWSGDATISEERKTDITAAEPSDRLARATVDTAKQTYTIAYETKIEHRLVFEAEFSLDVTDTTKDGTAVKDYNTREVKPELELNFEAPWWDLTAKGSVKQKDTQDPKAKDTVDETWSIEYNAEPKRAAAAPAIKLKTENDRSIANDEVETVEQSYEGTLEYTFWKFLDLKLNGKQTLSDEQQQVDRDKDDREYKVEIALDRTFGKNAKIEAKWDQTRTQNRTLSNGGRELDRDDKLKNNFDAKGAVTPFEGLEFSLEKKSEWNNDLQEGTLEVTETLTGDSKYDRDLTETIDFGLEYKGERQDKRGGATNSKKFTKDYAVDLGFDPLENLDFTSSFDRKDERENFADEEGDDKRKIDDKWEIKADTSVWDENVTLTITRSYNTSTENSTKTQDEKKWDVQLGFKFEDIPNFEFSPEYSYIETKDVAKDTLSEDKTIRADIGYTVKLGENSSLGVDHSYTRTGSKKDTGSSIQRNDDTALVLTLDKFVEEMKIELKMNRKATDTSGDDKEPSIDYAYSADYEWTCIKNYVLGFEYKHDKKSASEDTRSFLVTLTAEFLDGLLSLNLEHEFSEQLEGARKDLHRYLIEVKGQF